MARPIEKTPIIRGEDVKRFKKNLWESLMPTLSPSEIIKEKKALKKMEADYKKMVLASNGVFY
ncbi:hypothetical protein FACS189432_02520 [Bacteroidia bacterium]|nr:hypothetical protein FACS189426_00580 [Bacteroidia bacterium]GHT26989.1 hypothetical protein FACS189432_02520 [Bacteroidia bacterium]